MWTKGTKSFIDVVTKGTSEAPICNFINFHNTYLALSNISALIETMYFE